MPIDAQEMTELRARLRTDVAYSRTALAALSYSVLVLKVFDHRFYSIGLLYVVLACLLYICDLVRRRKSRSEFADAMKANEGSQRWDDADLHPSMGPAKNPRDRIYGAPFSTAGWVVIAVTVLVACVEISLFALLLRI